MSSASLDQLEREVEQARARFAGDLARLRDPQTMDQAKTELISRARAYKDDAVERARDSVTERATGIVEDLKQRVSDNPTAAILIGAGIAWHLFQKPPITSLLIGSGLFALFRPDLVEEATTRIGGQLRSTVQETTAMVQTRAQEWTEQVSDMADQAGAQLSESAPLNAAIHAEEVVRQRIEDNPLLYSLAAAAVGAAIGVGAKRRQS